MKINVLLCDVFEDIMPFEDISYNSMIEDLFNSVHPNIKYEFYEAFARDLPDTIEEDAIYLIPGSRYEAYSDTPWLNELRHFIEELHDEKAKMIGICFGHQLIADTLGGLVEKAVVGNGLGVRDAEICESKFEREFPEKQVCLYNYHEDQVVILPSKAKIFAKSTFCPIEAYTIENHIICTQGHPEFDVSYMRFLIRNHCTNISEITRMKALKSLKKDTNGKEMASFMLKFLVH